MSVKFPEMRTRLWQAVDALCDPKGHYQLWLHGSRTAEAELDFEDTLLVVVDEMERFGSDLVGDVLLDDGELTAFKELTAAIESLLDDMGGNGDFADASATGAIWESCQSRACQLSMIMMRSGR